MSDQTYELNPVSHITAGAIGEPGHRTFFIQATKGKQTLALVCEKQQVLALADGIIRFLDEISSKYPDRQTEEVVYSERVMSLLEPVTPLFRAGQMGLGYDEDHDLLVIVIQEVADVGEIEGDGDIEDEGTEASEPAEGKRTARLWGTRQQMLAMSRYAKRVVSAGRPICGNCGQPIAPEGHFCPRRNGHPPIGYIP